MFHDYLEEIKAAKPRRIVCCFVGKFNPFHKGHLATYASLKHKFNTVYVCTKLDSDLFLTGKQKQQIIQASGVPAGAIKHMKGSGYNVFDLVDSVGANKNDILIVAFSAKDFEEKKGLLAPAKKDNIAAWELYKDDGSVLDPIGSQEKGKGYIWILPSEKLGGKPISSSLIRSAIEKGRWDNVQNMMATDEAFNLLKSIKSK